MVTGTSGVWLWGEDRHGLSEMPVYPCLGLGLFPRESLFVLGASEGLTLKSTEGDRCPFPASCHD